MSSAVTNSLYEAYRLFLSVQTKVYASKQKQSAQSVFIYTNK